MMNKYWMLMFSFLSVILMPVLCIVLISYGYSMCAGEDSKDTSEIQISQGHLRIDGYHWKKAMDRGKMNREEMIALRASDWVHYAKMYENNGGPSFVKVAVPLKEDRKRFFQGRIYSDMTKDTIRVVIMDDILYPVSVLGLVVEVKTDYGPPFFREDDLGLGLSKLKTR